MIPDPTTPFMGPSAHTRSSQTPWSCSPCSSPWPRPATPSSLPSACLRPEGQLPSRSLYLQAPGHQPSLWPAPYWTHDLLLSLGHVLLSLTFTHVITHPLPGRHLLILWDSMQQSCAGAQASLEESTAPPVPPPRPEPCPLTCFPLFAALRASRGRDTGKCLGKELGLPRAGVSLKRSQGPSLYLPLRRTQRE